MDYLHHKPIKQFTLDGNIHDDSAIGRLKIEYIKTIELQMRLTGYVPRLDVNPDFTIEYNEEKEIFTFNLSMYGTYVGKRKSEWISGIDGTVIVPILKSKSKRSYQDQESQLNQK
jgi:hypothetical protein